MNDPPPSRRLGHRLLLVVRRAPLVVTLVTLAMVGAAALTLGTSTKKAPRAGADCADHDLSVPHPYPVSGYWVYPRRDRCDWRATLQRIRHLGGDTLIQFGPTLEPRRIGPSGRVLSDSGRVDPAFDDCVDDGTTCFQAARAALRAANPANTIVQTYVYNSTEPFSEALLRCPDMERRLVANSHVYYSLLLPADGTSGTPCNFRRGGPYRLILVAGSAHDSVGILFSEADQLGMQVFAGIPAAAKDPAKPWMPALDHTNALIAFTRRVVDSYAQRYNGHRSFRGVYQTFEVQLRREPNQATLDLYARQHEVLDTVLPTKDVLVSPYWDARRRVDSGTPPAEVGAGFVKIAKTGVDIIAPQDSRGTGKAALFWEHQASQRVDKRLQPVFGVGATEYGEAYYAPVRAYYRAAAHSRDTLSRDGSAVELWATLEAFEPTANVTCASFTDRGRTDKARLDRVVTMTGPYPTKIISFMWDGLYTCRAGQPNTLSEQVAGDWDRPIVTGAFRTRADLLIRGYQLGGATVTLSWRDADGATQTRTVVVSQEGRYHPTVGRQDPRLPERMEELVLPLPERGPRERPVQIEVTNGSGKQTAHPYPLG